MGNSAKTEKIKKLDEAFKLRKWRKLSIEELEILIIIAEGRSRAEIVQNLYQGIEPKSPSGEKVRNHVENLNKQNLVWSEYNEKTKKVTKFHVHQDLYKELKEGYPHLCISKLEIFDFTITRDMARFKLDGPHFRGQFILEKDVKLKENNRYRYTGIINDDGSIAIRIQEEIIKIRNPELEKSTKELVGLQKLEEEE